MTTKNFLVHIRLMRLINKNQLRTLRKQNSKKKIGLCHGVFDILHNGHIEHFKNAKKKVDILVVSITEKKYVNKGPRQPLNSNDERISVLNSIKIIDHVYLNENKDATKVIKNLKPNYYFKGKDYLEIDTHGNLTNETNELKKNKGQLLFTTTKLLSSTKLFNNNYKWTSEQKEVLKKISKINLNDILKIFDGLLEKEINIIGEPIIDKYEECDILGTTTKDPAISILSKNNKAISGGVIAVAKMASTFVKKVNLYTYGDPKIIKRLIYPIKNIKIIYLSKNKEIQTKTRFINSNRGEKLLQITNLSKNTFTKYEINKSLNIIKKIKDDLIICDFGVGLFEKKLLKFLNNHKVKKFINVQTNSVNYGFNLFTKFTNSFYLSLDNREWSLGLNMRDLNINTIKNKLKRIPNKSITKGQLGATFIKKNNIINTPVFVKSVNDTTGSGDAYFILTSLLIMENTPNILIPFIGNLYAGMHGQGLGNQNIISKEKIIQNIISIRKI
jgi:cytidyltransferase-like protein